MQLNFSLTFYRIGYEHLKVISKFAKNQTSRILLQVINNDDNEEEREIHHNHIIDPLNPISKHPKINNQFPIN